MLQSNNFVYDYSTSSGLEFGCVDFDFGGRFVGEYLVVVVVVLDGFAVGKNSRGIHS